MFSTIIGLVTILLLFAVLPIWPYSKKWGLSTGHHAMAIILLIVFSFHLMSSNIETLPRSNP